MKETLDQGSDWFALYRKGDATAFKTVFDLHYRSILYYATKILRDDAVAEDVVSESFRKAWDYRDRIDTPRHLENFLYFVTRNACISQLRADRVEKTLVNEWGALADTQDNDEVLDLERVQTELIQLIYRHLETLPGGDILRMSYLEGKSTREIAAELNISENTVYISKSRALKALRILLSKKDWALFVLLFLREF